MSELTRETIENVDALAAKATQGDWTLEHADTGIAGPVINSDWDWVVWPNDEQDQDERAKAGDNNRLLLAYRIAWPQLKSAALRTVQAESAYDSQTCPDPRLGIALARLAEMKAERDELAEDASELKQDLAAQIHRTAEAQKALAQMRQERDMFESAEKREGR